MAAIILDGKKLAEKIKLNIHGEIKSLAKKPRIAVILVGEDYASKLYVKKKQEDCKKVGILSRRYNLNEDIKEEEIIKLIKNLNKDQGINGILIQLPLPKSINKKQALSHIDPKKDVDGLMSKIFQTCTPKGIIRLLSEYDIEVKGKNIVIINNSDIVGIPLANLLSEKYGTVTICNEYTANLIEHTKKADILVSGVGIPNFIKDDMVKDMAVIIDVGISKINNKVCGDVDFNKVKNKTSYITPVPGGVGPITVAMLLENTLEAYKLQNSK